MRSLVDSIIRTVTPILVGFVLSLAATWAIPLDPEFEGTLTAVLTTGFTALYYIAVRLFEEYVSPRFGWLLGKAAAPKYDERTEV